MKLTLFKSKLSQVSLYGALLTLSATAGAQTSYEINNSAQGAFVATGSPGNPVGTNLTTLNFGGSGTLAIASGSSTKGEFDSILMFDTAAGVSAFNNLYGVGNWTLTGITLGLASNFGTQGTQPSNTIFNTINGGSFGIDWLDNDTWVAGTGGGMGAAGYPTNSSISYAYVPTLLGYGYDSLGTFSYTPPGNNLYQYYSLPLDGNLVSDTDAGGDVSFYFYAPTNSQVSYLFNDQNFSSDHPELTLYATSTPEPGTLALLAAGLGGLLTARRRPRKS
jgi:hypothetical protein